MSTTGKPPTSNVSISMVRQGSSGDIDSIGTGSSDDVADDGNSLQLVLPRTAEGERPQRIRVCLEWSSSADGFVKCQTIATTEGEHGSEHDDFLEQAAAFSPGGIAGDFAPKRQYSDENDESKQNSPKMKENEPIRHKIDRATGDKRRLGGADGGSDLTTATPTPPTPHLADEERLNEEEDGKVAFVEVAEFAHEVTLSIDYDVDDTRTAPMPADPHREHVNGAVVVPDHLLVTPSPTSHLQPQQQAPTQHQGAAVLGQDRNGPALRLRRRDDSAGPSAALPAAGPNGGALGSTLYLTPHEMGQTAGVGPLMPTFDTPSVQRQQQQGIGSTFDGPLETPQHSAPVPSPPGIVRHAVDDGNVVVQSAGWKDALSKGEDAPAHLSVEAGAAVKEESKPEGVKPSPIVHRIGGTRRRNSRERQQEEQNEVRVVEDVAPRDAHNTQDHAQAAQSQEGAKPRVASPPAVKQCQSGGNTSVGLSTLADIYTDKQKMYYVNSNSNRHDPATVPNPPCLPEERDGPAGQQDQAAPPPPPPPPPQTSPPMRGNHAAPAPKVHHHAPQNQESVYQHYRDLYTQRFAPSNMAPPPWPMYHPHDPYHAYHQGYHGGGYPTPYAAFHHPQYYHPYGYHQYGMYPEEVPDHSGRVIDLHDGADSETSSVTLPAALPRVGSGHQDPHGHQSRRRDAANKPEVIDEGYEEEEATSSPRSMVGSPRSAPPRQGASEHFVSSATDMRNGGSSATVRSAPGGSTSGKLEIMGQIVEMLTPACCAATTSRTVRNLGALQPWHSVMSMNQHIGHYRDGVSYTARPGSPTSTRSDPGSSKSSKGRDQPNQQAYKTTRAGSSLSHLRGSFL